MRHIPPNLYTDTRNYVSLLLSLHGIHLLYDTRSEHIITLCKMLIVNTSTSENLKAAMHFKNSSLSGLPLGAQSGLTNSNTNTVIISMMITFLFV